MRAALGNLAARRRTLVLVLIAALAGSTAAWAYWAAKSNGSASGHVGSLTAPSIGSATAGGGTVTLSWGAVAAPGAGTLSYYVRRDGGAASSACPSSSAPATQTSCTDTGVATGTHSYTVTAVWHSWTATSSSAAAQVLTGAATHIVLTPATTSPTAGAGDNLTITAKDASNNTVTSYTGTKSLTFSGASTIGAFRPLVTASNGTAIAFGSSEPISFSSGVASGSVQGGGAMTLYKAETASIKVSDGAIDNASGVSVTVAPGGADSFALGTPSTQTAGAAFSETLTAKDAYGNTATSYGGKQTVAFSGPSSSPIGKAPSYPATVSFSAGTGTATPITLYDADEGATLSASQGAVSGSSASFAVNPTTAAGFALASEGTQTAGVSFSETITARDTYGNTATSYGGKQTVAFSGPSSSPSGKAPSYPSPVSFTAGIATATPITLYDAQTTALTATQSTLSGTSSSFSVAAAPAGSFIVPTPSTQTAGSAFNVTVTAKDAYGNAAASYEGPKTLTFTGPAESPGGEAPKYPGTVTFAAGSATAAITLFDAGSTTLTAKDGTITGSTGAFTVNAKSTTTQFGVSVPASVSAGTAFNATLTAEDAYGNTTTGYTGNRTIAFSGPSKSPSAKSPSYDTSLSFSSGKTTETATLYDAQTTTLVAKESFGSISGESESFAVASASPSSLSVATPGTQTAGTAFNLTITGAKDSFGNLVGGTQTVGFSGPSNAPDGTTPSYPSSATFTAGEAKAAVTLSDAQTTSVKVTSGSASATSSSFTVGPATITGLSLTAGASTLYAGQGDELTIKAVDTFENTVTSYTGPQTLWFSGAKASGVKAPTVSNSSGTPVPFESPTTIAFAAGVAKTSGTTGVMKLYAVETAHVAVSDHTVGSGSGLPIAVEATLISSLSLSNGGGFSGKGKIESGDGFAVKLSAPLAVGSVCSLWSGNTINHSLSGNNEVTVTIVDGTGTTHDSVTVSASKCTLHLGTIDLGSSAYVSGGNVTFTGTGSNASSIEYKASTNTLEVELGGTKGGLGKVAQVSSSAATLTPDASLTDEFGNVFPAFTTATTSEF